MNCNLTNKYNCHLLVINPEVHNISEIYLPIMHTQRKVQSHRPLYPSPLKPKHQKTHKRLKVSLISLEEDNNSETDEGPMHKNPPTFSHPYSLESKNKHLFRSKHLEVNNRAGDGDGDTPERTRTFSSYIPDSPITPSTRGSRLSTGDSYNLHYVEPPGSDSYCVQTHTHMGNVNTKYSLLTSRRVSRGREMGDLGELILKGAECFKEIKFLADLGLRRGVQTFIPTVDTHWNATAKLGHKKVLILDLDNTLIQSILGEAKPTLDIIYKTSDPHISFLLRPHALHFLRTLKHIYNIIIYTAAEAAYATCILNRIEELAGERLFCFTYSREYLFRLNPIIQVKRLVGGIDESQIVILDDCFIYWFHAPSNYVPVIPYIGGSDTALVYLESYLQGLAKARDVRVLNDRCLGIKAGMEKLLGGY